MANYAAVKAMLPQCSSQKDVVILKKALEDTGRVRAFARYVLTIEADGSVVVSQNSDFLLNVISVLAPCVVAGLVVPDGVVFEIGLSRTRPYANVEVTKANKKFRGFRHVESRRKNRDLTSSEWEKVFPILAELLTWVTRATRAKWAKQEAWFAKAAGKYVIRGVRFTVASADQFFFERCLMADLKLREKSLTRCARTLSWWLRLQKGKCYTDKQLRQKKGTPKVADLCAGLASRPDHWAKFVFSKISHETRPLIHQVCEIFKVRFQDHEALFLQAVSSITPQSLHPDYSVWLTREGGIQGKHGATFEMFPIVVGDISLSDPESFSHILD